MDKLTIHDICKKLETADLTSIDSPTLNKGSRGKQIELMLGIANSSNLTDLQDGEIKSFTIGQSIAITQLHHCLHEIINTKKVFRESKVGIKIVNTIYFAFAKNGTFQSWKYINHCYGIIEKMTEDYDFISKTIRNNYASKKWLHTINGPNKILQIRTKASKTKKGVYNSLVFNDIILNNKGMAFYLTSKFVKSLF